MIIPGELCDLNTFINSQRTNKYKGAALKKKETEKCAAAFMSHRTKTLQFPLTLKVTWFCKGKRKDKDNIRFGIKFIQDGMAGLIKNDGWSEIEGYRDAFKIDKENPRIEIEVLEYAN